MEPTPWHVFLDSPLRSCGLGTATVPSRFRLGIVAALESLLTLLTWLLARFPHAHHRSRFAYTLTFHSSYLPSVPLCCLRPSLWLGMPSA